jgi:predicted XRE-type DNA-binding protein
MGMTKDVMISRGSGNVFADLGLPDAEEHQLKAQIVTLIARIIEEQHLTQTLAATRMGLSQPDLSKLLRGGFRGFSLERLLWLARALGTDVDIRMKAPANTNQEGRVRLTVA